MAEPTIDRTFDQTAEHIHAAGTPCPTCGDTKPHFTRTIITGPTEPTMPKFVGHEICLCGHSRNAHSDIELCSKCPCEMFEAETNEPFVPPFDQHVSPAILEQRILDLERQLLNAHNTLDWTRKRLVQLERLLTCIAEMSKGDFSK